MVKVISTGTAQVTCWKCKSVLEYTFQDIKEVKSYDCGEVYDISHGLDCPICQSFVKTK